jgi:RimJ/RimL family protein N-acetyltransferase
MTDVRIEPWAAGDFDLVQKVMGDPRMTEHLGGPEDAAKLRDRHERYTKIAGTGTGRMFKIVDVGSGEAVGSVGFWEKEWIGDTVYETGWSVIPEHQGRGIAGAATRLALDAARSENKHRWVHAYPSVDNAASNAICRKLGFELLGAVDFEYPPGNPLRCNDWRFDLHA